MFLNRSFNECIVESEVSSVEDISTSSRHLKDENVEKLNFISSNGPHALFDSKMVLSFSVAYYWDAHFGIYSGMQMAQAHRKICWA